VANCAHGHRHPVGQGSSGRHDEDVIRGRPAQQRLQVRESWPGPAACSSEGLRGSAKRLLLPALPEAVKWASKLEGVAEGIRGGITIARGSASSGIGQAARAWALQE